MKLVNRQRFTNMLRTLVDVTEEGLTRVDITEPCRFNGWSTQYRLKESGRLLAQSLHATEGSQVYFIDLEWEQNHLIDFACPPHKSNIELGMDDRGWVFTAIRNRNDYPESHCIRILAGCRNFSLEQAKEHWRDNPEVYPRILMAEQIAIHRGWIPKQDIRSKVEEILRSMSDTDIIAYATELGVELPVDAGELACERIPTVVIHDWEEEPEGPIVDELLRL